MQGRTGGKRGCVNRCQPGADLNFRKRVAIGERKLPNRGYAVRDGNRLQRIIVVKCVLSNACNALCNLQVQDLRAVLKPGERIRRCTVRDRAASRNLQRAVVIELPSDAAGFAGVGHNGNVGIVNNRVVDRLIAAAHVCNALPLRKRSAKVNVRNRAAGSKRIGVEARKRSGEINFCQRGAVREYAVCNFRDTVVQCQGLQRGAVVKCPFTDGSHALRDRDRRQPGAVVES